MDQNGRRLKCATFYQIIWIINGSNQNMINTVYDRKIVFFCEESLEIMCTGPLGTKYINTIVQ